MRYQTRGREPRSEERLVVFDEVAKTLAKWFGLWPRAAKQPEGWQIRSE